MSECSHDCSSCSANCGSRTQEKTDFLEPLYRESKVKKVIGIVSGKGGVGKSMTTSLLGVAAMRKGLHTAILDADVTGPSIPQAFGLHERLLGNAEGIILPAMTNFGIEVVSLNLMLEEETQPVIWRGPVVADVVKQFWGKTLWKDIDVMFVDMPPGTGEVPLTVFQSIPLDGIVVVATTGISRNDRGESCEYGEHDECTSSGADREHELHQMSRLRQRDQGIWRQSY